MKKSTLVVTVLLALCLAGCTPSNQTVSQPPSSEASESVPPAPAEIPEASKPQSQLTESSAEKPAPGESSSAPSPGADAENAGEIVFELSSGEGKSITQSSSFQAKSGDVLTLAITSTISGGPVDLFLFSPDHNEQRIPIGNTTETQTIALSEGEWAYNCTGFFDSGSIHIVGTIA